MNRDVLFATGNDVRETPQALFNEWDSVFLFDCDVAALASNTKCMQYIGPDHEFEGLRDALAIKWPKGNVWCNPPYSRGLQAKFIAKAAQEAVTGTTTVMLLPARTDTVAFHEYIYNAARSEARPNVRIHFLRGRLKFDQEKNSAPFPSMIVVFRSR